MKAVGHFMTDYTEVDLLKFRPVIPTRVQLVATGVCAPVWQQSVGSSASKIKLSRVFCNAFDYAQASAHQ